MNGAAVPLGHDPAPEALVEGWSRALAEVREEDIETAGRVLARRLLAAESEDELLETQRRFSALAREGGRVAELLSDLSRRVEALREEWHDERRYTAAGLADLRERLEERAAYDPVDARREWLREVVRSLELGERAAADQIAAFDLPFEGEAPSALDELRHGLRRWTEGDTGAALETIERLADGQLAQRLSAGDDGRMRVTAHRVAAWMAMAGADADRARSHLDEALALDPASGRTLAERAALQLRLGQVDVATSEAHRAVEAASRNPVGHLVLGACAEAANDLAVADRLYTQGLAQLTPHDAASSPHRLSLLQPTGRMLLRLAEYLVTLDRATAALSVLEGLEDDVIADPRLYPEADVFRLRGRALEMLERFGEAAPAYFEAGRRDYWNEQFDAAVACLERSRQLDASPEETGWYLAAAVMATSFPQEMAGPISERVDYARAVWDDTHARHGWPMGAMSWAYLTRAYIVDEGTFLEEIAHATALWDAVTLVERALVHDTSDGVRWGVLARYLRAVGQDELALEAADHGAELGVTTYAVLSERLALLANAGRFGEAERVAAQIVATYGEVAWVSGVQAWLALHDHRPMEALEFLELPLAGDFDPAWYLALAAMSHLELGRRDEARDAYGLLLERAHAIDDLSRAEMAVASAVLGDMAQARGWAAEALERPSYTPSDVLAAVGFVAVVDRRFDDAAKLLRDAAEEATTERQLDEVLSGTRLRLAAAEEGEGPLRRAFEHLVDDGLEEAVEAVRERLRAAPRTGESVLAEALGEHAAADPLGSEGVALVAVHARRLTAAGEYEASADAYARLEGTSFDPEARIGLRGALENAGRREAEAGHVAEVRRLQERLRERGWTDAAGAAQAAASALMAADRPQEAFAELVDALPAAADEAQTIALHTGAGAAALRLRDARAADEHFGLAQELAAAQDDFGEVAELAVRRCLNAALSGDLAGAAKHARVAIAQWRMAGAFDPSASLRQELVAAAVPARAEGLVEGVVRALAALLRDGS